MSEILPALTLIFSAAALALLLSRQFDQPAIPLYIVSGLFLTSFVSFNQVLELSQVGIAFLIFIYGVKFSTSKLRSVADRGVITTLFSITGLTALSVPAAMLIGFHGVEIVVFAAASVLSSSLVGLELIRDDLRKELVHGRIIESIQLVQDLFAVILMLMLFSTPGNSLVYGFLIFIMAYSFKKGFTHLAEGFRDSTEIIMVFSLGTLALFVSTSYMFEISPVVGAFAAGLALSRYPYSLEIIDTVGSLKDFFTAILFVSIGAIAATTSTAVLLVAGLITVFTLVMKPFIIYAALRSMEENSRISFLTGLGLDQVSEFAVVIAIQAYVLNQVPLNLLQSVVVATAITMTVSSYTTRYEQKLYRIFSTLFNTDEELESSVEDPENHIILVGFDTQGRKVAEELEEDAELVVIEYDPEKIDGLRERGIDYVFGDVMHQKPWEEANFRKADLIVSTVPLRHISDRIINMDTDADRILRTPDVSQAYQLLDEGAAFVAVPKIMSGQRLSEHIRGVFNNQDYRHELRRRNMLELRKELREE